MHTKHQWELPTEWTRPQLPAQLIARRNRPFKYKLQGLQPRLPNTHFPTSNWLFDNEMTPREQGREALGKAPSLLSRLYPRHEILPLEDLLIKLASLSTLATPLAKTLYHFMDHADYREGLLRRVWCIQYRRAPELLEGFSLEQASTQIQV